MCVCVCVCVGQFVMHVKCSFKCIWFLEMYTLHVLPLERLGVAN